jgi:hypothetical protein
MPTYVLLFDPTGANPTNFTIPAGKALYLARAPQVEDGTATVQDLLSLTNYVLEDQITVCQTGVAAGTQVALAFMARSNQNILSVNAEVISPRGGIPNCG